MKKNQIDTLFADKLTDARLQPSERALMKFQERLVANQKPTRRIGLYYWTSAASIAVFVTAGILLQQNDQKLPLEAKIPQRSFTQTKPIEIRQLTIEKPINLKNIVKSVNQTNIVSSSIKKQKQEIEILPNENIILNEEKIIALQEEIIQDNYHEVRVGGNVKPLVAQTETDIILTIEDVPSVRGQEILMMLEFEPVQLAANLEKNPNQEFPSEFDTKRPVLAKIWQQWQNIKQGENVDFSFIGLKPKSKMMAKDKQK